MRVDLFCLQRLAKRQAAGIDPPLPAMGAGGRAAGVAREPAAMLARPALPHLGAPT